MGRGVFFSVETVEFEGFCVGDFRWAMGCTEDKKSLCVYLGDRFDSRGGG